MKKNKDIPAFSAGKHPVMSTKSKKKTFCGTLTPPEKSYHSHQTYGMRFDSVVIGVMQPFQLFPGSFKPEP